MGKSKNRGKKPVKQQGAGQISGFRSGMKKVAGKGKGKPKKSKMTFIEVLTTGFAIALVVIAIWQFTK